MKLFFYGWLILATLFSCDRNRCYVNVSLLDKDEIYLVYRGTDSKEGILSKEYSMRNKNASHVGFAVYTSGKWTVHHVMRSKHLDSDFLKTGICEFFDVNEKKIKYASVYSINDFSEKDKHNLLKELEKLTRLDVIFDRAFLHTNGEDKLYCSEMIVNALMEVDETRFDFQPHKKKLKSLHSKFLGRDTLHYYPVDIFQYDKNFSLVKDWYY
jgi:hypothetical protein